MSEPNAIKCHCNTHSPRNRMTHIGIWGNHAVVEVNHCLGLGVKPPRGYGMRKALYEAAAGYVGGFRIRDIAYYVLTRSLSRRVCDFALRLESPKRTAEFRGISIGRGKNLGLSVQDLEAHIGKPAQAWTQEEMSQLYLDMKAGVFREFPTEYLEDQS